MGLLKSYLNNVSEPKGLLGEAMLLGMNKGHASLAAWGTQFIDVKPSAHVLDVGCGGGANVRLFLMRCMQGRVDGIDLSELSVSRARAVNADAIEQGRCSIHLGSADSLPFDANQYDLVTAYETVYFWQDLAASFAEAYRVLKPGGHVLIANECSAGDPMSHWCAQIIDDMNVYSTEELAEYLYQVGFEDVVTHQDEKHPWMCVIGTKPAIFDVPSPDETGALQSSMGEPECDATQAEISQATSVREAGPLYDNWVPAHMAVSLCAGTAALGAGYVSARLLRAPRSLRVALAGATLACGSCVLWSIAARSSFSYEGECQLSRRIVEGTASFVNLPQGGSCLDVGCGSGALSIAVARRNPLASVVGVDRWGSDYANYSLELCERNAASEGCDNVRFTTGDARMLPFADETFDAVTSNYVYHNVVGANKQELLRETLRTLKKGGIFAIHDLMGPSRYGDMQAFMQELRAEGYERVEMVPTTQGLFMDKTEATLFMLSGSVLLFGKK